MPTVSLDVAEIRWCQNAPHLPSDKIILNCGRSWIGRHQLTSSHRPSTSYRNQKRPWKLTDSGKHDPAWSNMIQHDPTDSAKQSQHATVAGKEEEEVAWLQTQDVLQVSGQRIAGLDLFSAGCRNAWDPTAVEVLKIWMFVDLLLSDCQSTIECHRCCWLATIETSWIYWTIWTGYCWCDSKVINSSIEASQSIRPFKVRWSHLLPSYPGVRCESGEGNCEDTMSSP